jgi:signal recognition particle receptor subunit beta
VVVVGPGEGGKSTLIRRLAGDGAMNLEVSGRTVAMDHGVLRHGDTEITLIGVPGQPRFAAVREALVIGARAAIWLHPAGQAPDAATVSLLQSAELCDRPYLVFVNTRDGSAPTFIPVPSLKPPRGILCGNLIDSRADLEPLHEALADLLANCAWN